MRDKRLNVHNTDKMFNLRFFLRDKNDIVKVSILNREAIRKDMQSLKEESTLIPKRDTKTYIIFQEVMQDDALVQDIFNHGGFVTYYSDGNIPYHIVKLLHKNKKTSRVMVLIKSTYGYEEIRDIALTSMSGTVCVDVPIVYGVSDYTQVVAGLSDIRYRVDRVELSFPPLTEKEYNKAVEINTNVRKYYKKKEGKYYLKSEYKYNFFNYIRNACSHWKMYLYLLCDNEQDLKKLTALKEKDEAHRKGAYTW